MEVNSKYGDVRSDFKSQTDFAYAIQKNYEHCVFKLIQKCIDEFQNNPDCKIFIGSLLAGGVGIALPAASVVIHYDRWWNPAVEDQARDRVWRIGQTKTVICHRLVCPGTVDERVEEVVQGKRRIADMVLPKSRSLGDLDADQLKAALGIDAESLLTAEPDDVLEEHLSGASQ